MSNNALRISTRSHGSSSSNWWSAWESYVSQFRSAMRSNSPDSELHKLLTDCLNLYSVSLNVSSADEALSVISGFRCSPLEIAFMWMGRWRPTSAVVLVYSTMGVDFQGAMKETRIINRQVPEQNALSETQLSGLNALQKHARQAESELSQQFATLQMLLVEQDSVATLPLGEAKGDRSDFSTIRKLMNVKLSGLQTLLVKADSLRLHTLKVLLDLLTPVQAASCSVAAYELMHALKSLQKAL